MRVRDNLSKRTKIAMLDEVGVAQDGRHGGRAIRWHVTFRKRYSNTINAGVMLR